MGTKSWNRKIRFCGALVRYTLTISDCTLGPLFWLCPIEGSVTESAESDTNAVADDLTPSDAATLDDAQTDVLDDKSLDGVESVKTHPTAAGQW